MKIKRLSLSFFNLMLLEEFYLRLRPEQGKTLEKRSRAKNAKNPSTMKRQRKK